jgi:ubiquinone/menaquinone biosynthesis C-methylase UbiE
MESTMDENPKENWGSGGPYEQYVGRWSRKVAREFLNWLQIAPGQKWSDVGCGTGALVEMIVAECNPQSIAAIDRSEGFIAEARRRITDSRARFEAGDATSLSWPSGSFDATVLC